MDSNLQELLIKKGRINGLILSNKEKLKTKKLVLRFLDYKIAVHNYDIRNLKSEFDDRISKCKELMFIAEATDKQYKEFDKMIEQVKAKHAKIRED